MSSMIKKVEQYGTSKRTFFVFPTSIKVNDRPVIMDATDIIREANQRDKKRGYGIENGPNFGIEVARAEEFLSYINEYATSENYYKFSNRKYVLSVATD